MKTLLVMTFVLCASVASAQTPTPPTTTQERSALADAIVKEWGRLSEGCGKSVFSCVSGVATEHPMHFTFGRLAPQNGFGMGAAVVGHAFPETKAFRLFWSGDVVASTSGNWRAGVYFNFDQVNTRRPTVRRGRSASPQNPGSPPEASYSFFLQTISLNKLLFFGVGPGTQPAGESHWGLKETVTGGRVYKPNRSSTLALIGGVTGRLIDVRSDPGDVKSIDQLYVDLTAPGLAVRHASFAQFSGTAEATPYWFGRWGVPVYALTADLFVSDSASKASFNRLTVDLAHEFALYGRGRPKDTPRRIDPNHCSDSDDPKNPCPAVFNRDGGITLRFVETASWAHAGNIVPFYLQPTLGGSDLNGASLLSGFGDYRFRAPNLIAFQESFNHSLPVRGVFKAIGIFLMAEQGKVTLDRGDLSFSGLRRSFTAGFSFRAGGFPEVIASFAWTNEAHHYGMWVNPILLGGGARPPLF